MLNQRGFNEQSKEMLWKRELPKIELPISSKTISQ